MAGRKPGFLVSVYIPALKLKSIRFNSICILKITCGKKTTWDSRYSTCTWRVVEIAWKILVFGEGNTVPVVGQKSPTSFVQLHGQVFDIECSWKWIYIMASHGIEWLLGVPASCWESFHFQSPTGFSGNVPKCPICQCRDSGNTSLNHKPPASTNTLPFGIKNRTFLLIQDCTMVIKYRFVNICILMRELNPINIWICNVSLCLCLCFSVRCSSPCAFWKQEGL